jgi:hypothetical protein
MLPRHLWFVVCVIFLSIGGGVLAQLVDRTTALSTSNEGIALSLTEQVGAGRGDWFTEDSSVFIVNRDPFRAIRRGRQLFQRKFTVGVGGVVMGLGYNAKQDKLYATDWKTPKSALYVVDTKNGFLTPMADIGYPLSHGLVAF